MCFCQLIHFYWPKLDAMAMTEYLMPVVYYLTGIRHVFLKSELNPLDAVWLPTCLLRSQTMCSLFSFFFFGGGGGRANRLQPRPLYSQAIFSKPMIILIALLWTLPSWSKPSLQRRTTGELDVPAELWSRFCKQVWLFHLTVDYSDRRLHELS